MKKLNIFIIAAAMLASATAKAQDKVEDFGIFDHLGADVTLGIDGIGLNLAAPITNYLQVRAGVSYMPTINVYSTNINYTYGSPSKNASVDAKFPIGWVNGKLLFDVYPFKKTPFRISLGAFVGTRDVLKAHNNEATPVLHDPGEGIYFGDVLVMPDKNDNVRMNLRVNTIKPYVGLGYGYDVPKSRVGVTCELGALFWGKPSMWVQGDNDDFVKANKDDFNKDVKDAINTVSKFSVLPILNIGVAVRLF